MSKNINDVLKKLQKLNSDVVFKIVDDKIVSSKPASKLYLSDGYYINDGIIMIGDYQVGKFEYNNELVNEDDLFNNDDSIGSTNEIDSIIDRINISNNDEEKEEQEEEKETIEETTEEEKEEEEEKETIEETTEEENKEEVEEVKEKKNRFRKFIRKVFNPVRLSISNFLEKNKGSFSFNDNNYLIHDPNLKFSGNGIDELSEKKSIMREIKEIIVKTKSLFDENKNSITKEQYIDTYNLLRRYSVLRNNYKNVSLESFVDLKIDIENNYSSLKAKLDKKENSYSINTNNNKIVNNKKVRVDSMNSNLNSKIEKIENKINKIEFELSNNRKLKETFNNELSLLRDRFYLLYDLNTAGELSNDDIRELDKIDADTNNIIDKINNENKKNVEEPVIVNAKETNNNKVVIKDNDLSNALLQIKTNKRELPKVIEIPRFIKEITTEKEEKKFDNKNENTSTVEEKITKAEDKLPELERMLKEAKVSLNVCEEVDKEYFKEKKEKLERLIDDIIVASRRKKVEEYAEKEVYKNEAIALYEEYLAEEKKEEEKRKEDSQRAMDATNEFYRNDYIAYWESLSDDELSPYSNVPASILDEVLDIKKQVRELESKKKELLGGKSKISLYDESISDDVILELRHIAIELKKLSEKEKEIIKNSDNNKKLKK